MPVARLISYLLVSLMLLHPLLDVFSVDSTDRQGYSANQSLSRSYKTGPEKIDLFGKNNNAVEGNLFKPLIENSQNLAVLKELIDLEEPCFDCSNGGCCHFSLPGKISIDTNKLFPQVIPEKQYAKIDLFPSVSFRPPIV